MASWDTLRNDLARAFRDLYEDAKPSGAVEVSVARAAGFSQSKVSRILNGKLSPSPEDAGTLARALGANDPLTAKLSRLALQVAEERAAITPTRVILDGGTANHQRRIGRHEERSSHVAAYHPLLVPGLLQTEAYIAAVARAGYPVEPADGDLREFVASRIARQRTMSEPGRTCTFVVPETALLWALLDSEGMAGQVDHIARVSAERPSWRIGVIPRGTPPRARPVYMLNGFTLYDERAVLIGTTGGNALITDERDISRHRDLLSRLEALAEFGDDGREVLTRVAHDYRERATPCQ